MEILLATTRGEQLKSHPFSGVAFKGHYIPQLIYTSRGFFLAVADTL